MANIGKVYRSSYEKDGKPVPTIIMEIRTLTMKKEFTIAVNKNKWESGIVGSGPIVQGKEEHPDYHIWAFVGKRGESISEIVGSIKDAEKQETGLKYKRANIFDPFIQKESIYFTLFAVDEDKKIDKNHLYNVVSQPYRANASNHQQQTATPNYNNQQPQYQNSDDTQNIPDVDNDEIPF